MRIFTAETWAQGFCEDHGKFWSFQHMWIHYWNVKSNISYQIYWCVISCIFQRNCNKNYYAWFEISDFPVLAHCVLVFLEFSFSVSICMQGAWHPRIWMHWQIGKLRDGLRKWPAMWREDRGGTVPCYSHKNSKLLCIHNSSTCSHLPEPAECGEPSINLLFCKVSALVDWQKWQSGIVRRWVMRTPVWAQGRGHHHGHGPHYHGVSQVSVIPLWLENTRIFNLSEWGKGSPTPTGAGPIMSGRWYLILEWSDTRRADWGPIKLNVTQSLADSGKCLCRMINALALC